MGWIDTLLGVAGIGLDIYGQNQQASATAGAHAENAARKEKEAEYQAYRTDKALDDLEAYKDQVIGKQRVTMAKNGIIIDQNTAQRVVEDSARRYDLDVEAIKTEGKFAIDRARLGAQSSLESASQVKKAGYISMGRTLLSAASDFNFFE
jgi:hypothetical protein